MLYFLWDIIIEFHSNNESKNPDLIFLFRSSSLDTLTSCFYLQFFLLLLLLSTSQHSLFQLFILLFLSPPRFFFLSSPITSLLSLSTYLITLSPPLLHTSSLHCVPFLHLLPMSLHVST